MTEDPTDLDLVIAARAGDRASFAILLKRHCPRLLALARHIVGPDTAEDVMQEAAADAYQDLDGFAGRSAVGTIRGPTGRSMAPAEPGRDLVLVATGVGIAPFYSLARHLLEAGFDRQVRIFWGLRLAEDICLLDELDALAAAHLNFSYRISLSRPPSDWDGLRGRISESMPPLLDTLGATQFHLCGNGAMIEELTMALSDVGVADKAHLQRAVLRRPAPSRPERRRRHPVPVRGHRPVLALRPPAGRPVRPRTASRPPQHEHRPTRLGDRRSRRPKTGREGRHGPRNPPRATRQGPGGRRPLPQRMGSRPDQRSRAHPR